MTDSVTIFLPIAGAVIGLLFLYLVYRVGVHFGMKRGRKIGYREGWFNHHHETMLEKNTRASDDAASRH